MWKQLKTLLFNSFFHYIYITILLLNTFISCTYHHQQNKWYPQRCLLHSILANLLAHNNKFVTAVKFHYRVLQLTAVFLTPLGVPFILLAANPFSWKHFCRSYQLTFSNITMISITRHFNVFFKHHSSNAHVSRNVTSPT